MPEAKKQRLRLAVWDYPPADFLMFGYTCGAVPCPFEIVRGDPEACAEWLRDGHVDAALVPALTVLRNHEGYEVIPDVGFVAASNPNARILVKESLNAVRRMAFNPRNAQEVLMARTVFKEHYAASPEFVPYPRIDVDDALEHNDAVLVVDPSAPMLTMERVSLDLGQEWFELTAFPMVWGMFVARAGVLLPGQAGSIKRSVRAAEARYDLWVQAQESPEVIHNFFEQSFRSRLDTYALEGLDMFAQHMFFYGVLSEVPVLPFMVIPEAKDEEESDRDQDNDKDTD
jgi:chorismate dehydratase